MGNKHTQGPWQHNAIGTSELNVSIDALNMARAAIAAATK